VHASNACCRQIAPVSVDNILIAKTDRVTKIAKIRTLLVPLMGINVAEETTRSQALPQSLVTRLHSATKLAIRATRRTPPKSSMASP